MDVWSLAAIWLYRQRRTLTVYEHGVIMNKGVRTILGVLALVVAAVACGPTDTGVGTKVRANITADVTLKTSQIDVGVQNKVVTLSGTVDTSSLKERAVEVARATEGVADVIDQVVVKNASPGPEFGRQMMEKGMSESKDHTEAEKRQ